jgi:hypothetical protein
MCGSLAVHWRFFEIALPPSVTGHLASMLRNPIKAIASIMMI